MAYGRSRKPVYAPGSNPGGRILSDHGLVEPSGGICQQRVDLAGVRRQVIARYGRPAISPRDIVEQPLEFVDIVLDGGAELGIRPVFVADLVERFLALRRVQAPRK